MVSNSTSVAGLKLSEDHIYLNDGLFEVLLVRYPKTMAEQQAILNGLLKREAVPDLLAVFRTSKLEIESKEPLAWTLDGEFGGDIEKVEIENCQGAIRVLVGPDADFPAE